MPDTTMLDPVIHEFNRAVRTEIENFEFPVFVGGPSLKGRNTSARARRRIIRLLKKYKFDVYTGENDELETVRINSAFDAQTNEVRFIGDKCRAIILVAASPGSFCELGLFSWHYVLDQSTPFDRNQLHFWVISDITHETKDSYVNQGPIAALNSTNANVVYEDLKSFDGSKVISELISIRSRAAIMT